MPFSISRSSALALACALLALLALGGHRLARVGAAGGVEPAAQAAAPLEQVAAAPSERRALVVHVVGAVRRPGLYRLREGARVADAVARAGGAARNADLAALNLAAPLVDGTQVLVPPRPAEDAEGAAGGLAGQPPSSLAATAGGRRPSLSSATAEELDQLPGVGPVTAQRIIDYRTAHGPFRSVDDLDAVPGIGPARIEQLRDLVTP
ncbi:MAG TPA: ComEA family DNA-binding protein [Gaiellaceae bacterium]|jgi:competence protein ComEA|nr:ComEA family DNA-binding protein [Gaiellaceae bacterium]